MTLAAGREDSENDMWSEYLEIVDEYDKRLTERWKADTEGVLVFVSSHALVPVSTTMTIRETALFSTTVASFILASYPQLSPDTGGQTVFLLGQLSQQFAAFANGTQVQPEPLPSSPPSASIVYVNILWLLSFLLSTTSALFATMMQQWGRIYMALPQTQSIPSHRARVRSFLFLGTKKYSMDSVVEIAPTLLHLSVFLFYIGLVIFLFTIHKTVAVAILISVGLFGLVYFAPTILPCIDHSCPYSTPMLRPWWYLWHTFFLVVGGCLNFLLKRFHYCCVPYNLGEPTSSIQSTLTRWLETIEKFAKKHEGRLRDGFRETVVKYARGAPENTDVKALTWAFRLPALAEKGKIQKFIASIPGKTVVELFKQGNPTDHEKITFRHHLSTLFRTSCAPDTAGPAEEMRKGRLLVCLNAIRHIAKDSIISPSSPSFSSPLLDDIRSKFANIVLMRPLWADSDPAIRVTARSICALLARQLLRKSDLEAWELSWLQDVMDRPSSMIFNAHNSNNLATVDNMNVYSFVNGVLSQQTEVLPVQAAFFEETLKDIMNRNSQTSLQADTLEERLSSLIRRMEKEEGRQDRDSVVDKLPRMSSSTTSRPQSQPSGS